ncbi:MAG: universal stress protein [Bacteroidia bacterium]|nr:universal stress protein [Bacteroidia bacterium]
MAVDIAKQSKGEVHLVNVVELPVMHDTVLMPVMAFEETMLADMRANAEKQFKKLKEKHAKEGPKIKTKTEFGSVSPMLIHYIKDEKIDLVVMGTHGASGLRELVIGSNAEKNSANITRTRYHSQEVCEGGSH